MVPKFFDKGGEMSNEKYLSDISTVGYSPGASSGIGGG